MIKKQYKSNEPAPSAANKQCYFSQNNIKHIDYKDVDILKKFLNPHARLNSGEKTGVSARNQRKLATAVKRARFMGLLPYVAQ
ncbi:MAG: 30S ribosomal protein S18 [bacterium]|nr:30S ribosomal protein S18 [bacterium]